MSTRPSIHPQSDRGSPRKPIPRQEEGPNTDGFIFQLSLRDREQHERQSDPRKLNEPYWDRYTALFETEDGKSCYDVQFLIGQNCKPEFYHALIEALPTKNVGQVASATFPLAQRLEELVKKHYPDVRIEHYQGRFVAKHSTMQFMIHGRDLTGRISDKPYPTEGPSFKGFILEVTPEEGEYQGMARVPQTLREPYWSTFIGAPATEDGKGYFRVNFSYGSRLDEEFKKAVMEAFSSKVREVDEPQKPE